MSFSRDSSVLIGAQFLVQLGHIIIPLCKEEVAGHRVAEVVFCCHIICLGAPTVVHREGQFRVRVSEPSFLLVHCRGNTIPW